MEESRDKFCYIYSCSVESKIQIKIGTLEGNVPVPTYTQILKDPSLEHSGLFISKKTGSKADLVVYVQIFADGHAITRKMSTKYKAFEKRWNWNEWMTFPISYAALPRNAQLCINIYDTAGPQKMVPVGGSTVCLFGKDGIFRQGRLDLKVWPSVEADSSNPTTTPGEATDGEDKMTKLADLTKKHHDGRISKVDWADKKVFRKIEVINENEKKASDCLSMTLEFAEITIDEVPYCIVYYEKNGDEVIQHRSHPDILTVPDSNISHEDIIEAKHQKLVRGLRSGGNAKDLKPTSIIRDRLNALISYPPTRALTSKEQDLVWKFRFYLSTQKKALTKFVKSVNWKEPEQELQALEMLRVWTRPDPEDALELLGPSFKHPAVRKYGIECLTRASDDDLMLYLLQLVQALKYEDFEDIENAGKNCIDKKSNNEDVAKSSVHSNSRRRNREINIINNNNHTVGTNECAQNDLASFLIMRASRNSTLTNYLYWYLLIECENQKDVSGSVLQQDKKVHDMYFTVSKRFTSSLSNANLIQQKRREVLIKQTVFVKRLVILAQCVANERGNRQKKTEKLQALLSNTESAMNFMDFDPIPLPLDPDVYIKGIIPSKASLFNSVLKPIKLTFLTTANTEYVAIFKNGDDLRQDQLILQTIALMDKLLRRENLDLKLTPYRVLATGTRHGFLQCIDSKTVAEVLASDGSILNFFRKHHPSKTGPYGVASEIMDTYIRSCAGYCIITYILGVGDRHLDNLLLTTSGNLFHIDFGYILGSDPKPLPPPMKLSQEMVDAMGGLESEYYAEFKKQCHTAFLHLRRHANVILNLFSLMVDASLPEFALEPDKAVKKVEDKLHLELTDEEAVKHVESVIRTSVGDIVAALVEKIHKLTQDWRK